VESNKPISFAALIRVSTDRQATEGESLKTQRTEIEHAAKQLGGKVAEWYGGQEHATPGWEKKELSRLLADAAKKHPRFNAVIVTHPDRWSRDNADSKKGLDILRKAGVKFYVGSAEHDLFNPTATLFLGMSAEIGEFHARLQSQKSIQNRIARAKRGIPTCGKLPFARTFDREMGKWGVDTQKQRSIENVARRYLAGEPMPQLAEELGVNHASLHKTLTKRCGDKWEQTFDCDSLNIHEAVTTTIPPLLPRETIKAILAKVEANKTYRHGQPKHPYLLGRMVICEKCGYAYFGQTNHGERRYYRHAHTKRNRKCESSKGWVRADELEDAVLRHLFNTFGNPAAFERAVERALPNLDAHRQHEQRLAELDALIGKEMDGRQKVLKLVQRGLCDTDEAGEGLREAKEKIDRFQAERDRLAALASNIPSAAEVKQTAASVVSKFNRVSKADVRINAARGVSAGDFKGMKWEDKRDLLQRVFAGKTPDGQRAGVYIEWPKGKGGACRYTIKGLITRSGSLPMTEGTKELMVDPDGPIAERQEEVTKYAWH
jgi:site-specific DNA recombinase